MFGGGGESPWVSVWRRKGHLGVWRRRGPLAVWEEERAPGGLAEEKKAPPRWLGEGEMAPKWLTEEERAPGCLVEKERVGQQWKSRQLGDCRRIGSPMWLLEEAGANWAGGPFPPMSL